MSSLAERLKEAKEAATKPKTSPFEEWFNLLEDDDRESLLAHAQASDLPIRTLFEAVKAHEPPAPISRENFASWLRANGYKR